MTPIPLLRQDTSAVVGWICGNCGRIWPAKHWTIGNAEGCCLCDRCEKPTCTPGGHERVAHHACIRAQLADSESDQYAKAKKVALVDYRGQFVCLPGREPEESAAQPLIDASIKDVVTWYEDRSVVVVRATTEEA